MTNVEVQQAKNGENTIKINEYYIHSKYNPSREAEQVVKTHYTPHHVHIFFGYGCGHVVEALLKLRQFNETVFVVDPLFNDNKIKRPFSLVEQNIYYLKSDILHDFEQYLSQLARKTRIKYKVICLPNYEKLFPEEYRLLLEKTKDVQNRNLVNDMTLLRFSKVWYDNFFLNLPNLQMDYSASVLEKQYTAPAIIISGGPSLGKQLDYVKKYRQQFILICAGSTINSLLAQSIEPDYVVTIDGGEANFKHFAELKLQQSKIVYTMQNHPKIRKSFEKPGYVVESKGHPKLTRFIKEELGLELPMFLGGASVAHTAYSFATYITKGPVALIGQDLAYTDDLTHAPSNKNSRKIDAAFIKRRQAFQIESYSGEKVWTDPVFNSMRLEFEDLLKIEPPQNEVFNCTEGGAYINGFEQMPFKQFCETFARDENVRIIEHASWNNHFSVKHSMQFELQQYNKLEKILDDALVVLKRNYPKKAFDARSFKQLDKIDESIQRLMDQLVIDLLISPVTMRVMENYLPTQHETALEQFERSYNQMNDLYTSMKVCVQEATAMLQQLLEEENE